MKFCKYCNSYLPKSEFNTRKASPDGLGYKCKSCEKIYREARPAHRKKLRKANYEKNKTHERAKSLAYYRDNRSDCIEKHSNYMARTKGKQKVYRKKNKALTIANTARYRAAKDKRTPPWLTEEHKEQIKAFYVKCELIQKETGVPHHVDHIIPLRGEAVSGLHVPWNLQILSAAENIAKGNRFE